MFLKKESGTIGAAENSGRLTQKIEKKVLTNKKRYGIISFA